MSKKILLAAVLVPVILISAYIVSRDMNAFGEFTEYFEKVSAVIDESAEKNETERDTNYQQNVEKLNQEIAAGMDRIYQSYGGDTGNIKTAISLTRGLFDELFRLRREFAAVVEPFLSERMQDRKTVKNKESYEWRLSVLDGIDQYAAGYHSRLELIVENFRQAVTGSNLPEKYKQHVWQHWARDLNSRLTKLGPAVEQFESDVTDYRRLFNYLYEYSDVYYVGENGQIVIRNDRHLKEYQSIAKAVGGGW
jgi:hypothetical protein